jgi:ClpP class serine protease
MILDRIWAADSHALRMMIAQFNEPRLTSQVMADAPTITVPGTTTTGTLITAGPADDASREGLPIRRIGGTAMIGIAGMLMKSPSIFAQWMGVRSLDMIKRAVQAADGDDEVDQILLVIQSPGGSVYGLVDVANTIAATQKPVTAQIDGYAFSAAYWLASLPLPAMSWALSV